MKKNKKVQFAVEVDISNKCFDDDTCVSSCCIVQKITNESSKDVKPPEVKPPTKNS